MDAKKKKIWLAPLLELDNVAKKYRFYQPMEIDNLLAELPLHESFWYYEFVEADRRELRIFTCCSKGILNHLSILFVSFTHRWPIEIYDLR